jgi:TRAP-type uncharacterized transport system fused permease subunit
VRGVLPVVAVCAAAGIITATTTKTGLGAQLASLLVSGAQAITSNPTAVLALTVVLAAVALAILGLAVPVTASFIIGWVIIGPALIALGVPEPAAAMFVFYYSVLSEVTPPTALAAVGASAITGGRTVPTMWQALKYALPAFLVPIAFVLTSSGSFLLARGSVPEVAWATGVAGLAVAGLAVAAGGYVLGIGPARTPSRVLAAVAGLLLLYLEPTTIAIGAGALAAAVLLAAIDRHRTGPPPAEPSSPDSGSPAPVSPAPVSPTEAPASDSSTEARSSTVSASAPADAASARGDESPAKPAAAEPTRPAPPPAPSPSTESAP